jgi:alpha-tubulin suppressor-like RCC1 family protein
LANNFYYTQESNGFGFSLGDNNQKQRCTKGTVFTSPTQMDFGAIDKPILQLSAGYEYLMAITSDGLYGCGKNDYGSKFQNNFQEIWDF